MRDAVQLPSEILSHILLFVISTHPPSILATLFVSRRLFYLSIPLLYARPPLALPSQLERFLVSISSPVATLVHYPALIKRINLTNVCQTVDDAALKLLMGCNRLERVCLNGCYRLTEDTLITAFTTWENLVTVDVCDVPAVTDNVVEALATHTALRHLYMSGCGQITNASVVMLSTACIQIRRIKLARCSLLTNAIGPYIASLDQLGELDVSNCANLSTEFAMTVLTKLYALRELMLAHVPQLRDASFTAFANGDAIRVLNLVGCTQLTDAMMMHLVNHVPKLRQLEIAKCSEITDAAFIHGVTTSRTWPRTLQHVHLGHVARLTDDGLTALVRHCPRIKYLDLACCVRLTDRGVAEIARLSKLKRLGLVRCSRITDQALEALAGRIDPSLLDPTGSTPPLEAGLAGVSRSLERIHLSYCVRLSAVGVLKFLLQCKRITHLSLTGVPSFLQGNVQHYCRAPPPDFSLAQRSMFCVYSGFGVSMLRDHLISRYSDELSCFQVALYSDYDEQ
jgi:F-box and leucine-rich repeat protein GRR1